MKNFLLLLMMILTACGGSDSGGGGNSTPPEIKSLFSVWHHTDSNMTLDLTSASFEEYSAMPFNFPQGVCGCDLTLSGSESSGSFELNNCLLIEGDEAPELSCNALNTTGLFSNKNKQLVLTAANGAQLSYR